MSWMDARYQARHYYYYDFTSYDLTGAVADIKSFHVFYPKIQIIEFGIIAAAAFSAAVTMTTLPVVSLQNTPLATGVKANLNANAVVSPAYSQAINAVQTQQLDLALSVTGTFTGLRGKANLPTAVVGDLLTLRLTTQGVGGTQTANFYILFREIEA